MIHDTRNVMTATDALTEAILDHEHDMQPMDDEQRDRYRPRARSRAQFLVRWLNDNGWHVARTEH